MQKTGETQGWKDLQEHAISNKDVVIGISASGTAPYVIGALKDCQENGVTTGCVSCNLNSPMAAASDVSGRGCGWTRIRYWEHQNESWHCSKVGVEHDYYHYHGEAWKSKRQ